MDMQVIEQNGKRIVTGTVGKPLLHTVDDVVAIIEACANYDTSRVLLYAENLTEHFFDLSSQEAGAILHKLRTYQVRMAVVYSPEKVKLSSRFGDLMIEENRNRYFRLMTERSQAESWLFEE
jgi:hypothetical protein